jgi:hypothetical protein
MTLHRGSYNYWKSGKGGLITSFLLFDEYGLDNCFIELLEAKPCASRDEMKQLEGGYIRNLACVNKCIAGRTMKEYHEDNKTRINKTQKEYQEINKEKVKQYYEKNKERISEKAKEYRENNKDKISYACINNDDNYMNYLFSIVNNKNQHGLPSQEIHADQISVGGPYNLLEKSYSGDLYQHVVIYFVCSIFFKPKILAELKSINFKMPSSLIIILAGFKSLCTIPAKWIHFVANKI